MANFKTILMTFSLFMGSQLLFAQTISANWVDGRIYVKVKQATELPLEDLLRDNPLTSGLFYEYNITKVKKAFVTPGEELSKVYRINFSNFTKVEDLIQDLTALEFIEYAEKAPLYPIDFIPNDYSVALLYHLDIIDAQFAWDIENGDNQIVISIVDNGVLTTHNDLSPSLWTNPGEIPNNGFDDDFNGFVDDYNGVDVTDNDGNPNPPAGAVNAFTHGTHVAGIAAARTNNGTGVASIGYQAKIMSVKTTSDNSDGNALSDTYEGVDYSISEGAKVINMSFGSPDNTATWNILLNQAAINNILLVASAGNDNNEVVNYPAGYSQVISVASTDQSDSKSNFSNYNTSVDVCAPGSSIRSTFFFDNNSYGNLSGTSMSSPMVAGLGSLLFSYNPSYTVTQVRNFIQNGCETIPDMSNPTYQNKLGAGRINARNSMLLASGQGLGIEDENLISFEVYPNPTEGNVYVRSTPGQFSKVEVMDQTGATIQSFVIEENQSDILINTDNIAAGIYLIRTDNPTIGVKKFVKR